MVLFSGKTYDLEYDFLNRLIREDSGIQDKSILYTYDAGGNLTSIKEYKFALNADLNDEDLIRTYTGIYAGSTDAATATEGETFEIWKDQLLNWKVEDQQEDTPQVVKNISMTYDAIGNMLTKGSKSFSWRQGSRKPFREAASDR